MHTLLDLRGCIPSFIHISNGKLADVNVLDVLPLEAGAFYIIDRGYLDFSRLYAMHQADAFFATYVLIAIVKKELALKSSLYTCLQILSVSVFEKTLISCALQAGDTHPNHLPPLSS